MRNAETSNYGAEVDVIGHVLSVSHIGSSCEECIKKPETDEDCHTCFLNKHSLKQTPLFRHHYF